MCVVLDKDVVADWKFDPRAGACYEEWINASKEDDQQEQEQVNDKYQDAEA
jgi:hypothetical protein